jgi:hypothetical protein
MLFGFQPYLMGRRNAVVVVAPTLMTYAAILQNRPWAKVDLLLAVTIVKIGFWGRNLWLGSASPGEEHYWLL